MVRATLLLVLTAAGISGCAMLAGLRGEDPRAQLREGVEAATAQEFLRARALLDPLVRERPDELIGQQAWLVLIATELDSRNPERRLWAAADLAARLLTAPVEPWIGPVAESYYLVALELGAAEERVAQAEARTEELERALPTLTRPTVPERLERVTAERDQARRQAEQLQQQLATRDRELREARQELERIRRTIRP